MTSAFDDSSIPFAGHSADLTRDGSITIRPAPPGPPQRIDGYTIGVQISLVGAGPHNGEVHPDGDEFLHVVSGVMELILDDGDQANVGAETTVVLRAGDAYVVPRGMWHKLVATEPSHLVHVTPGPNGGHRPLPS